MATHNNERSRYGDQYVMVQICDLPVFLISIGTRVTIMSSTILVKLSAWMPDMSSMVLVKLSAWMAEMTMVNICGTSFEHDICLMLLIPHCNCALCFCCTNPNSETNCIKIAMLLPVTPKLEHSILNKSQHASWLWQLTFHTEVIVVCPEEVS